MTLTKKHFIEMAKFTSESPVMVRTMLADFFAKLGSQENPNFNHQRFMDACNLTSTTGRNIDNLSIVKLDAGHDRNGNGRRLYILVDKKIGFISVIKEYAGDRGMKEYLQTQGYTDAEVKTIFGTGPLEISTTFKFYREVLKRYGKG